MIILYFAANVNTVLFLFYVNLWRKLCFDQLSFKKISIVVLCVIK